MHAASETDLIYGPPNDLPEDSGRHIKKKLSTFGFHLLNSEYAHVDFRLRHLVARCLCEEPADRPGFEEIHAEIQWAWDKRDPTELAAAAQWCKDYFERPPYPEVPSWRKVRAVSLFLFPPFPLFFFQA